MSRMPRRPAHLAWSSALTLAIGCALFAGCADEALDPVPVAPTTTPTEEPTTTPTTEPTAPPKRTILERRPFGNVAMRDNLLWDGDFEWASAFASQYGWYQLPSSLTLDEPVVGPICRSGIKCARVQKNDDILGIAVGARDEALYARVSVRFEPDDEGAVDACSEASVVVFDLSFHAPVDDDIELTLLTPVPDVSGWCTFAAMVPPRVNKPYVLVSNHGDGPMLVDDAVLLRASSPSVPPGAIPPALPLRAGLDGHVAQRKAEARALPRGGEGRPSPARDALERRQRDRAAAAGRDLSKVKP